MSWEEEYRSLVFATKFSREDLEAGFHLKYLNIPDKIYKYRNFNPDSLDNLINNTVWLGDPNKMNDPYDCCHRFDTSFICKQIDEKTVFKKVDEKNIPQLRSLLKEYMSRRNAEIISRLSAKVKSLFKFCSFSERINSILMWAHYADSHKGFCIEYPSKSFPETHFSSRFLHPVIYSDELFDASEILKNLPDCNIRMNLAGLYKARDWEHEKEWRLLFTNGIAPNATAFKLPVKPSAVYLGSEMLEENKTEIRRICKTLEIPVFQIVHSVHKYEMVVKGDV